MKINGIKALDYQCQGDSLTLTLTETDFETVSNLNTALVEVRTDDGDLVRRTAAMRCVPSPTTRTSRPTLLLAPHPLTARSRRRSRSWLLRWRS